MCSCIRRCRSLRIFVLASGFDPPSDLVIVIQAGTHHMVERKLDTRLCGIPQKEDILSSNATQDNERIIAVNRR